MGSLVSGLRVRALLTLPATILILTFRCTDIIMAREVETPHRFGDKPWLGFEHVTMTPLGRNLIEPSLLTKDEIKWVNDYHAEVWEKTHGFFANDELSRNWLRRETQPL
jgi:Xaa-Pro aminopeptidase